MWVKASTRPNFSQLDQLLTSQDSFTASTLKTLEIDLQNDTKFLIDPKLNKGRSSFLAIPFRVTPGACNVFGKMHGGMSATLVDIVTSLHVSERNLPAVSSHDTSSLSVKYMSSGNQDTTLIALSQIDKMGKRLVFSRMRIIEDPSNKSIDEWIQAHAANATKCPQSGHSQFPDAESIVQFVNQYRKVVTTGQHVKMFTSSPAPLDGES